MSTEYRAVLAVGKSFVDIPFAIQFLKDQQIINEENVQSIEDNGLQDSLDELGLEGGILDYWSGEGFWIGFELDTQNLDLSYYDGKLKWSRLFNVPFEVVLEVEIS